MQLVPFRSFNKELGTFEKELDKLLKRFSGETLFDSPFKNEWMPSVDISETKDTYVVSVELPGMDAKDVSVTLSDDFLTIKGEKKEETEEKRRITIFPSASLDHSSALSSFQPE